MGNSTFRQRTGRPPSRPTQLNPQCRSLIKLCRSFPNSAEHCSGLAEPLGTTNKRINAVPPADYGAISPAGLFGKSPKFFGWHVAQHSRSSPWGAPGSSCLTSVSRFPGSMPAADAAALKPAGRYPLHVGEVGDGNNDHCSAREFGTDPAMPPDSQSVRARRWYPDLMKLPAGL